MAVKLLLVLLLASISCHGLHQDWTYKSRSEEDQVGGRMIGLGRRTEGLVLPDSDTRPISSRRRRQAADGGDQRGRPQRATASPLQGLSLLDLPVFSRGDRPSSMDKTLGAIFSKVAFSAASNQSGTASSAAAAASAAATPVLPQTTGNKNNDAIDKIEDRNATVANATTSTTTTSTNRPTSSTAAAASTGSEPESSESGSSTTPSSPLVRSKPVFEFDTRIFDFIPYERTPPPPADPGRQYNPNVPGLRGPSRINTARNPSGGNNLPFNLRPTIPPLVDLMSTTTTSTTTTTTTPSTTTTASSTTTTTTTEPITWAQEETTTTSQAPTTASSTSPSTASSASSSEEEPAGSADNNNGNSPNGEGVGSREAAWSVQVYGASTLFALLGLYTLSNLLRLRTSTRRLLTTSHCLSIQLLVLFLAITRSIHLLYDAYNHRRLLPPALAFSIFNVAFPCLSSALAVLLLGIFKATKLQVVPGVLVKPALWAALVAFHFALSLSIDIVVGSVGGLFSLHLASQAYFVLWSLALSLGYLAAFAPATRAAHSLQTETMRSQLTALHLHGASLPRMLPQPTLLKAVRVTLAAAVLALLVAAFQLYGMFGVYGLPWRQQQNTAVSPSAVATPVVLTPEFLARYQGLQRDRNLNVDALREVLGLPLASLPMAEPQQQRDPWPVATENFWPWWTYQLIARLLEFVMATLITYVAAQPLRHSQATMADKQSDGTSSSSSAATKKSSLWLFTGRSLRSGSMETLSTLCCQSNRLGRNSSAAATRGEMVGGVLTDLSPVKSMSSDESPYPTANMRNYCYSNPQTGQHHHHHPERPSIPIPLDHSGTLPAFPVVYGSKRSSQMQRPRTCANTLAHPAPASSVLVNDNGFIRFRDGVEQQEQPYEEVDRQRTLATAAGDHHHHHHHSQQHIYQELSQHKAPSLTYYSTSSSMTSSSNTNKGTATTPSTCTYEHLCRRGLAGYYEPQRYEMQLPNNAQLLSLLAKESCQMFQPCNIYGGSLSGQHPPPPTQHLLLHRQPCQHCHCQSGVAPSESSATMMMNTSCCAKSPNYESYGPKPEAQTPANEVLQASQMCPVTDLDKTPCSSSDVGEDCSILTDSESPRSPVDSSIRNNNNNNGNKMMMKHTSSPDSGIDMNMSLSNSLLFGLRTTIQRFRTSSNATSSSANTSATLSYDYSLLVASEQQQSSPGLPVLSRSTCLPSSPADEMKTTTKRGDQSSSGSYWLSPDLLRQHTEQLYSRASSSSPSDHPTIIPTTQMELCDAHPTATTTTTPLAGPVCTSKLIQPAEETSSL